MLTWRSVGFPLVLGGVALLAAGSAFAGDAPVLTVLDGGSFTGPAAPPQPAYGFDDAGLPNLAPPTVGSLLATHQDDEVAPTPVQPRPVTVSQLEAPIAIPFEGATLTAGLHSRDRQSYPRAGSSTAAEFELTYRF
jgi:hypothetical protein